MNGTLCYTRGESYRLKGASNDLPSHIFATFRPPALPDRWPASSAAAEVGVRYLLLLLLLLALMLMERGGGLLVLNNRGGGGGGGTSES